MDHYGYTILDGVDDNIGVLSFSITTLYKENALTCILSRHGEDLNGKFPLRCLSMRLVIMYTGEPTCQQRVRFRVKGGEW